MSRKPHPLSAHSQYDQEGREIKRVCKVCGELKDIAVFPKTSKGYRRRSCNNCWYLANKERMLAASKSWWERHPEKSLEYARRSYAKRKQATLKMPLEEYEAVLARNRERYRLRRQRAAGLTPK